MSRPPDLEKRERVASALFDAPDASDREISRRARVSPPLVRTVRHLMFGAPMSKDFTQNQPFPGAPSRLTAPSPRDLNPGALPMMPLVAKVGESPDRPAPRHPPFLFLYVPGTFEVYSAPGVAPFVGPKVFRRALTDGVNGATCRLDKTSGQIRWSLEAFYRNCSQRNVGILGWEQNYLKAVGFDSYIAAWETLAEDGSIARTDSAVAGFVRFVQSKVSDGSLPSPQEHHLTALRDRLQVYGKIAKGNPVTEAQASALAFVEDALSAA